MTDKKWVVELIHTLQSSEHRIRKQETNQIKKEDAEIGVLIGRVNKGHSFARPKFHTALIVSEIEQKFSK